MADVDREILEQVLAGSIEPLVIVRTDQPDWPIVLANPAFFAIGGEDVVGQPFADVIEATGGRELALDVSESVRSGEAASFPVETGSREYLLALRPLLTAEDSTPRFYAAFLRSSVSSASGSSAETQQALLKAKRRIRDLSRDDPATGLLNAQAFNDVFAHDWAVATREKSRLSLVTFTLEEFDAYVDVRRASDVVARPGGAVFVALSHSSEEDGVREFAARIAAAVRELGLHHPRATSSKFVTVAVEVAVAEPASESRGAGAFLDELLDRISQ